MRELSHELESYRHHTYIRRGDIQDVLSGIVARQQIDLAVLGTHGREGIKKVLMGSIAEKFARQSPCPVVIVGPKAAGKLREDFDETGKDIRPNEIDLKQIVLAVDFTPESLAAVPLAVSLAEEFQARLVLLHVVNRHASTFVEHPRERLISLVPEEAVLWCRPEAIVKIGSVEGNILMTAAEVKSDLIVIGARSAKDHPGTATHYPFSIAHGVIANAPCPVLIVRKS
jgi:nucleotide-binding universal stress UspA family protein